MRFLLDTHLLLWTARDSPKLSKEARALIGDTGNLRYFSVASIWETAVKAGLKRIDFRWDARLLRRGLLSRDIRELVIDGEHAAATSQLPPIHKDPFDRMLVAQATVEGITLLTSDPVIARYPGPIRLV